MLTVTAWTVWYLYPAKLLFQASFCVLCCPLVAGPAAAALCSWPDMRTVVRHIGCAHNFLIQQVFMKMVYDTKHG